MFDDLREQAGDTSYFEEEEIFAVTAAPQRDFLGMTPAQRLIVAILLLFITCLLSAFCLLATGSVVL